MAFGTTFLVAGLAGCGTGSSASGPSATPSNPASATTTQPSSAESASPSAAAPADDLGSAGPLAPVAVNELPPVGVEQPVDLGAGLVVRVTRVDDVELKPTAPGEIAGAGVAVHVRVDNAGAAEVDLTGLAVQLDEGGLPASPSRAEPASSLTGALSAEESVEGVFVFLRPGGAEGDYTVRVEHNGVPDVAVIQP